MLFNFRSSHAPWRAELTSIDNAVPMLFLNLMAQ